MNNEKKLLAKRLEIIGISIILFATCWQIFFENPVHMWVDQHNDFLLAENVRMIGPKLLHIADYLESIKVPEAVINPYTERDKLTKELFKIDEYLEEFDNKKVLKSEENLLDFAQRIRTALFILGSLMTITAKAIELENFKSTDDSKNV
jgi:hypothetical protein